jgi:hypothetical protein
MTVTVTSDNLGTYLGVAVDPTRATYILGLAVSLCLSVVNPLPAGAEAVVLDVAARGYGNPQNVQQEHTGPFTVSYGAVRGGLWLTQANKAVLRRLNGGGGAFDIDVTPAGAGTNLPPWDTGTYDVWPWGEGWY